MTIEIARTAKDTQSVSILPQMANRHGLITGATGTGKTVTLQRMAEQFSLLGVPVFLADVKGDLAGIAAAAQPNDKINERLKILKVTDWQARGNPVEFWDIQGALGHPLRATISDMGPLLLSRLLGLNDTQEGVLQLVFKVADDQGLLLLDVKDLRAMLQHVGDHAQEYTTQYGLIAAASIGAIQRGLLSLTGQGAEAFFGEPMLNIDDLIQSGSGDMRGHGVINVMAAEKIMTTPALYAIFLLWLLAELFERLPEVGDGPKPKLVFFFDEAHLLFQDALPALLQKVEQVVRLIRSKGVGIYFVTQNPMDVPESILAQLGHRVHHAMRAFTLKEQKTIKTVAETLRANPNLDMEKALMEMGVGEALISFLDEKGRPGMVEQALVLPPMSRIGPLTAAERQQNLQASPLTGYYEKQLDRVSAYEKLQQAPQATSAAQEDGKKEGGIASTLGNVLLDRTGPRGGRQEGILSSAARSAARSIGSQVGRQIIRGILGSILGGRK